MTILKLAKYLKQNDRFIYHGLKCIVKDTPSQPSIYGYIDMYVCEIENEEVCNEILIRVHQDERFIFIGRKTTT